MLKKSFSVIFGIGLLAGLIAPVNLEASTNKPQKRESPALAPGEPTSSIILDATQSNILYQVYHGAKLAQVGQANQQDIESFSFGQYALYVETKMLKDFASVVLFLQALDFGPLGPVQGWLVENGFHPDLAYILEYNLKPRAISFDSISYVAARRLMKNDEDQPSVEDVKKRVVELQKISYLLPPGGNLALDAAGRPEQYDPELRNVLAHAARLRLQIADAAEIGVVGFWPGLKSHFYSLTDRYDRLMSLPESLELIAIDLQGLMDTVRYKLTHPQADRMSEVRDLNQLLDESLKLKREFLVLFSELVGKSQKSGPAFTDLTGSILDQDIVFENFRRKMTRFADTAVKRLDSILGFQEGSVQSLQFDTPWELSFSMAKQERHMLGLAGTWENIRTFQIITYEEHKTAHWTTQETEHYTDSNGKPRTRTVTKHHYSSSTDYDYETVPTPDYEIVIANMLALFIDRTFTLAESKSKNKMKEIDELEAEVRKAKSEHARYAMNPSRGKDEDEHRVKRVRNQQAQFRAILSQLQLIEVQTDKEIPKFNREASAVPSWSAEIKTPLAARDKRNGKRVMWTSIGTGVSAAASAACYYILNGGLQ